jgi:hypothetical protein
MYIFKNYPDENPGPLTQGEAASNAAGGAFNAGRDGDGGKEGRVRGGEREGEEGKGWEPPEFVCCLRPWMQGKLFSKLVAVVQATNTELRWEHFLNF